MENKRRTLKNIIMIAIAVLMIAALVFTTGIVKIGGGDMPQGAQGQPPQMQSEDGDAQVTELSDKEDGEEQPEKADGEEPPEKPDGEEASDKGDGEEPPELPEGMDESDMKTPPSGEDAQQGEKPDGMMGGMSITKFILTGAEGLILSIIVMYLIMSGFNRKTFKETLPTAKKKVIYIIVTVVLGAVIFAAATFIPMKLMGPGGGQGGPGQLPDGEDKQVTELQD